LRHALAQFSVETPVMRVRSCKVTIRDLLGTEHSVLVTAGSLYETVALGLASIRTNL